MPTSTILGGILISICMYLFMKRTYTSRILSAKRLEGKVVVITGSSKGIGEQLAYQYAGRGCTLILAARTTSLLEKVKDRCLSLGSPRVHILHFDASSQNSCDSFVSQVHKAEGGKVDILVLNHAASVTKALFELGDAKAQGDAVKSMIDTNYLGYVYPALGLLPSLESSGSLDSPSSLIVVSSLAGKVTTPLVHAYAASKHAIDGFFSGLRHELETSKKDIRVKLTVGVLGAIKTEGFLESMNPSIHGLAVDAVETSRVIVEHGLMHTGVFYHPKYIQFLPIIQSISYDLAYYISRKTFGL
ncbi:hypothetical protein HDV05_005949 [Chytridiales sp. JEL 0842]|nr:hypothetical protein HDV05_005949 [Chytridiales sp. JEL 0842]